MMKAILPAKLLLCNVYRSIASKSSWEADVTIDSHCQKDLEWWMSSLSSWNGAPLCTREVDLQLETDVNRTGMGGYNSFNGY